MEEKTQALANVRTPGDAGLASIESALEEIAENISAGEAICTKQEVVAIVDRPQDIEEDEAMTFFGGEEGDADQSQG